VTAFLLHMIRGPFSGTVNQKAWPCRKGFRILFGRSSENRNKKRRSPMRAWLYFAKVPFVHDRTTL